MRRTLAVLIDHLDYFGGGFESGLRDALDAAVGRLGHNLLFVAGAALEASDPLSVSRNRVYELVGPRAADGALLVSSALATSAGPAAVERLCDRLRPLPLCSLGIAVGGVPSILLDESSGMEALTEHLISHHGRRRLAFIGGPVRNADSIARLEVFERVLARHGLALDERLFASGHFTMPSGAQAMLEILARGEPFDAVVAGNDGMARGVIDVLARRGIRVPRDVLVTGFDDLPMARFAEPPLATVRQPLDLIASRAVEVLLTQIEGRRAPDSTLLAAEFIPRTSCGCEARFPEARTPGRVEPCGERTLSELGRELDAHLDQELSSHPAGTATHLRQSVEAELAGEPGALLRTVERVLAGLEPRSEHYEELDQALLRLNAELGNPPELVRAFRDAERLVLVAAARAQARKALLVETSYRRLLKAGERLATAVDVDTLKQLLGEELPELPIRNVGLSLYANPEQSELEPLFCLTDGELFEPALGRFDARLLAPPDTLPTTRRHTSFVLPLATEGRPWGVAVLEVGRRFGISQLLAEQVAAALDALNLHGERVRQTALHERGIQERLAAAERMDSLATLAGGVAHDLNNALGPLVALPDTMLAELDQIRQDPSYDDSELRADIRAIRETALRASNTIKDLLTLGRRGRIQKTPLDLSRLVGQCFAGQAVRLAVPGRQAVRLELAVAPEALPIIGSESQLFRALTNIVQNAADALPEGGQVVVRTGRVHLVAARAGYETIAPGDYAVVTIEDDGPGIPEHIRGRVFEPFFTTKSAREYSGSGLGLAIVHGVVKEHDGYVDVQSPEGLGTSFMLYFPIARAAPTSKRPSRDPKSVAHILVVDDEPLQLRSAKRILEQRGYSVSTLSSGRNAYERFVEAAAHPTRPNPYDLVIFDVMLGEEQDGLEIMRRVRELFPSQRGLLMSGHAPLARGADAERLAIGWLAKPFGSEALASAVEAALGNTTLR